MTSTPVVVELVNSKAVATIDTPPNFKILMAKCKMERK